MPTDFEFRTVWRVAGNCAEVAAVLADARERTRWWPAVYLGARGIEFGPSGGVGALYELHTKGWLPYTLRWTLTQTEQPSATGFAISAEGDLQGTGRWRLVQDGPEVEISHTWKVNLAKRGLHRLAPLLKPIFAANHRWAMRTGEQSLRLELRRRRAGSDAERRRIPAPPRPTFRRRLARDDPWPASDIEL